MNHFSVVRELKFEAAHRLAYHKGKCKNLHGHNYKVVVCFLYSGILHKNGMVVDFKEIDNLLKPIIAYFDHSVILNKNEDQPLINFCIKEAWNVVQLDGDPTAENISKFFYDCLISKIHDSSLNIRLQWVEIKENDESSAVIA